MTPEQESYVRFKSTQSNEWCVLYTRFDGVLTVRYFPGFYSFAMKSFSALYQFRVDTSALCIARKGVIMVQRKGQTQ